MSATEQTNDKKALAILDEAWALREAFLSPNASLRPNTVYIDFESFRAVLAHPRFFNWVETHPVEKMFGMRVVQVNPCRDKERHLHVTHNPAFE